MEITGSVDTGLLLPQVRLITSAPSNRAPRSGNEYKIEQERGFSLLSLSLFENYLFSEVKCHFRGSSEMNFK